MHGCIIQYAGGCRFYSAGQSSNRENRLRWCVLDGILLPLLELFPKNSPKEKKVVHQNTNSHIPSRSSNGHDQH